MERLKFLDLGGGPDAGITHRSLESNEELFRQIHLRAFTLAEEHPEALIAVVDNKLPRDIRRYFKDAYPNVHFIVGEIDAGSRLPFPDGTFQTVEMNFVFTPMSEDSWRWGQKTPSQWAKRVANESHTPTYARALEEAARVLEPGGELLLCERKSRMSAIQRILRKQGVLKKRDNPLLARTHLVPLTLTEITDPKRSPQVASCLETRQILMSQERFATAEDNRVFELTLVKI